MFLLFDNLISQILLLKNQAGVYSTFGESTRNKKPIKQPHVLLHMVRLLVVCCFTDVET